MNAASYAIHRVMNQHRPFEVCDDCEEFARRWYPESRNKFWRRPTPVGRVESEEQ